jgi:hypothetical protein
MRAIRVGLRRSPVAAIAVAIAALVAFDGALAADDRVAVTGTVGMRSEGRFQLDTGEGSIAVVTDGWRNAGNGPVLELGDRVTVFGQVDDDLLARRTLAADAVYVFSRRALLHTRRSGEDAGWAHAAPLAGLPEGTRIQLTGSVGSIAGRAFVLETGDDDGRIRVQTGRMPYDPLDDLGPQRLSTGDRVSVEGYLDDADFFESHELHADSITTLEGDDAAPAP